MNISSLVSSHSTMDYNTVQHSFPKLYAQDKNGKIKVWTAAVLRSSVSGMVASRITHGYINGKQQIAFRECDSGKNIGRSNETTPLEQCISETRRKWLDKKEKEAYTETKPADYGEGYGDISGNDFGDGGDGEAGEDGVGVGVTPGRPFLPMLAQTFDPATVLAAGTKKKKVITFPCFVQPKLDGLRCVSYMLRNNNDLTVALQSRTGAFFTGLPHIAAALRPYLLATSKYCHRRRIIHRPNAV